MGNEGTIPGKEGAPAGGPGWKGSPAPARFSPLGPVAQLPAGPGVAVTARFAAGVRGAAQVAVALRGVLGAVPAVRLLPAAPGQPWLVAHCRESDLLTPKPHLRPSSLPGSHWPPQPSNEGTHLGCCGQWWLPVASWPPVGSWQGRGLARAGRHLRGAPRGEAGVPPGREAQRGPPPRLHAGWCSAGLPRSKLGTGRGHQEPPGGPSPTRGTHHSATGQRRPAGTAAPGSAQTLNWTRWGEDDSGVTRTGHRAQTSLPCPCHSSQQGRTAPLSASAAVRRFGKVGSCKGGSALSPPGTPAEGEAPSKGDGN